MQTILGAIGVIVRNSQKEHDYLFSSEKFDSTFGFGATPYTQGIAETARLYNSV